MLFVALGLAIAGPRAVAHDDMIIACEGAAVSACPSSVESVSVAAPGASSVVLTTQPATLGVGGDPCDWVRVPKLAGEQGKQKVRTATSLSLASKLYATQIGEATSLPIRSFTALWKVDLEGDGVDEVLFAAESHPSSPNKPFPMTPGWSVVGLRKLVGDEVKTIVLARHQPKPSEHEPHPHYQRATLQGVTDLDGDGALEVVYGSAFYEGYTHSVVSVSATGAVKELGSSGCGA